MEFHILGSLEVVAEGRRLDLRGPSERKLLAALLLNASHVVSVSHLIDVLWEDDPPDTAAKQVRNAVSRLRHLLAAAGMPDLIRTDGLGYRLTLDEAALDAQLFEERVRQAEVARSAGQVLEAADLLRSALGLWRGAALSGLSGRVIEAAATAWNERRCAVAETYYDHQLALGRHREILSELSALVAEHPLRGRPVGQLMVALYRCGRQVDALALYRDTRRLLAQEMGLDPDLELQQLQQQILQGSAALAVPQPGTSDNRQALVQLLPAPRQLPSAIPHFAGRAGELKSLNELLDQADDASGPGAVVISAIDGMAGIGKTTLALYWAHQIAGRFPDGQLYANLRGFDPAGSPVPPADAIRGFLDAFQISPEQLPAGLEAQQGLYRSLLAGQRMLIVLDNARDSAQVRPLLPGSPECLVIVTSRSKLTGLMVAEGACTLTLGLPAEQDARELLALRLGPERIAGEPAAADKVIGLCGRLPLAMGIAAARAASKPEYPLAALAEELKAAGSILNVLETGDTATDVRAVFSWSYQNLSSRSARMFRLLGVHPGPHISLPAAASLAGVTLAHARTALDELTRAHLLTVTAPGRFAFHDLLHAYAVELASHDKTTHRTATHRLLDHYLHTSHSGAMVLNPARPPLSLRALRPGVRAEKLADSGHALAWFTAELPVLLAATASATQSGFNTHAWQLPSAMADFLDSRGRWSDLAGTQQIALQAAARLGDRAGQAYAHRALARASSQLGSPAEAAAHLRHALEDYHRLGDRIGQAHVHHDLGILAEQEHRYGDALKHSSQTLELARAAGSRLMQAHALNAVGWCRALLGDYPQALAYCEQALDLHSTLGRRHDQAFTWDSLGYAHHHLGHHREAANCYAHALDLHRELGNRYYEAVVRTHQADCEYAAGNIQQARDAWQDALAILDDLHHPDAGQVRAQLAQLPQRPGS